MRRNRKTDPDKSARFSGTECECADNAIIFECPCKFGIVTRNIRREEHEYSGVCFSLSLSPSFSHSLLLVHVLSHHQQRVSVCEVCQGPTPLRNPIFETKSKI